MARKSYEDAVDYYYRALKQANFANAVVWNKLGIAYQQLQNYQAARKAYNQAIRHQKNYAEPLNNIGTIYFMQDKYGKSVKYYLRALKLNPNSASYHLNLGTSYFHMKKYKESVEEYRTALNLDPECLYGTLRVRDDDRRHVEPIPNTTFTWGRFLLLWAVWRRPCATFAGLLRTGSKIERESSTIPTS